jgi:hypothetical protein
LLPVQFTFRWTRFAGLHGSAFWFLVLCRLLVRTLPYTGTPFFTSSMISSAFGSGITRTGLLRLHICVMCALRGKKKKKKKKVWFG